MKKLVPILNSVHTELRYACVTVFPEIDVIFIAIAVTKNSFGKDFKETRVNCESNSPLRTISVVCDWFKALLHNMLFC